MKINITLEAVNTGTLSEWEIKQGIIELLTNSSFLSLEDNDIAITDYNVRITV